MYIYIYVQHMATSEGGKGARSVKVNIWPCEAQDMGASEAGKGARASISKRGRAVTDVDSTQHDPRNMNEPNRRLRRTEEMNDAALALFGHDVCWDVRLKESKECGGTSICEHNRIRKQCKQCGGPRICAHNRQRSGCQQCGGVSISEHNRQRYSCKQCSGASICG
jgi:ribosomal protein S27AE